MPRQGKRVTTKQSVSLTSQSKDVRKAIDIALEIVIGIAKDGGIARSKVAQLDLLKVKTFMSQARKAPTFAQAKILATAARVEVWAWITKGYRDRTVNQGGGYGQFRNDWKAMRLCIDLQTRLMVEQVCFDLGHPWSQVCTQFRPIS